jgi:cytochrome c biogenesis protein CcdA
MKKVYYIIYTLFLSFVLLNCFCTFSFGAYPKLVNTITSAFETIESWLLRISTPAAAVAVGSGIFMKKFSFGDEERLRTGKKIIRGSLFSYAFILCIDLILSAIQLLVSKGEQG